KGSSEEQQIKDVLTEYTQALLDFTYFEENKLVDEEFPESTAKERLHHILGYLNKVHIIVSDIFGSDADMIDVLGVDIVECLYWRKGALYYMYSHTVNQDKDRVKRNLQDFTQSLRDGVEFLTKMSNLRVPLSEQEQVDYNDECTLKLIQQGRYD
ncbi:RAB7A-interacting MON1-CCZ1 complex subunit 1-like, partial [Saccoglossus kowalevskii]|uniref:UPF0600 protein C5orf51 homolog n=1 Tax=Saccoglossus kowalevskii TaxID=10224 RepID=A0ABM0M2J2_SACKO